MDILALVLGFIAGVAVEGFFGGPVFKAATYLAKLVANKTS